mgnify:CR=1 FL=1
MERKDDILDEVTSGEYKYGFVTDIDTETFPKGLSEEVVRRISRIKGEPGWMTDYRLKAYRHWLTLTMPRWLFRRSTFRTSATMPLRKRSLGWRAWTRSIRS